MNHILTLSSQASIYTYNQGSDLFYISLPFTRTPHAKHLHRGFAGDFHSCVYKESPVFLFRTTKKQVVLLHNLNNSHSFTEILLLEAKDNQEDFQDFYLTEIQDRLFFFYTIHSSKHNTCQLYCNLPFEQAGVAAIYDFDYNQEKKSIEKQEVDTLNQRIEYISKQYQDLYHYTTKLQREAKRLHSLLEDRD